MFHCEGGKKSFDENFISLLKERKCEEVLSIIKLDHLTLDFVDSNGTHLLHLLAKYDSIGVINFYIKSKYKVDVEDSSGMTPTVIAASQKNYEAAKILHTAHFEALIQQEIRKNDLLPVNHYARSREHQIPKIHIPYLKKLVSKLKLRGLDSKQIGEILAKFGYRLINVVKFYDPVMTEAFLKTGVYDETWESAMSQVVETYSLQHIEVLINHRIPGRESFKSHFIDSLMMNISEIHKSKDGKDFLEKVFSWEIFEQDDLWYFERSLESILPDNVLIFLQYDFHSMVEAKWGRDILGAIFGNDCFCFMLPNLGYQIIDVDKRYHKENTGLHIAARECTSMNIKLLLDLGADPNAFNNDRDTPLCTALEFTHEDSKCVELLLLGGADPSIVELEDRIFRWDKKLNDKSNIHMMEILGAHIALMEACGLSVEQTIKTYMKCSNKSLQTFFGECRKQLNKMKTYKICDTRKYQKNGINMFTLLAEKPEKIERWIGQEDLKIIDELFARKKTSLKPYYCNALKIRVEGIVEIKNLRKVVAVIICQLTGIQGPDHVVIHKIVHYFSIKDLILYQFYSLPDFIQLKNF